MSFYQQIMDLGSPSQNIEYKTPSEQTRVQSLGWGLTQSLSLFITSGLMEAIKFSCIFVSMAPGLKDRT